MINQYVNDFTESLQVYHNSLKKYAPFTKEEEVELFRQYKNGSMAAKDKIVKANLKFAFSIAKKYSGRGVSMEDLVSEANYGLLHAIDKYDPDMGNKFISYAVWWIRRYVSLAVLNESNKMKDDSILEADMSNGKAGLLEDPEDEKVKVKEACMEDVVEGDDENDENVRFTVSLMEALDIKEKHVISKLFGVGGHKECPLRELSKEMGISIERVRQIKKNAIGKMRINALSSDKKYSKFFS